MINKYLAEFEEFNKNAVVASRRLVIQEYSTFDYSEENLIKDAILSTSNQQYKIFLVIVWIKNILASKDSWKNLSHSSVLLSSSISKIETVLNDFSQILPSSVALYYRAIIEFCSMNIVGSLNMFSECAKLNKVDKALYGWDLGVNSLEFYTLDKLLNFPEINENSFPVDSGVSWYKSLDGRSCVNIIVGCDSVYFSAFHEDLIRSYSRLNNKDIRLLFHVINPKKETFFEFENVISHYSGLSIGLSYEYVNTDDKAYFASVRFSKLEYFLSKLEGDILTLDADCPLRDGVGDFLVALTEFDLAVTSCDGPGGYVPWRRNSAGILFVKNNEKGVLFSKILAHQLKILWKDKKGHNWWIDQSAILLAWLTVSQDVGVYRIYNFQRYLRENGVMPYYTGEEYKKKKLAEPASSSIENGEIFYDCKDFFVKVSGSYNPERAVVTFTEYNLNSEYDLFNRKGFGEYFLLKRGFYTVNFISKKNNWWQSCHLRDALSKVINIPLSGVSNVVTYGSSMGGYAAIKFAELLNAKRAVAFCPQYSVNPKVVPFENRWPQESSSITYIVDDNNKLSSKIKYFVFYDSKMPLDKKHANLFKEQGASIVDVPNSGHNPLKYLIDLDLVNQYLVDLLNQHDIDFHLLSKALNDKKRRSSIYYVQTARLLLARRKYKSMLTITTRGVELYPESEALSLLKLRALNLTGQLNLESEEVRAYMGILKNNPYFYDFLYHYYLENNNKAIAIKMIEKAISLTPKSSSANKAFIEKMNRV